MMAPVGFTEVSIHDRELGLEFPLAVFYPTEEKSRGPAKLGPFQVDATINAEMQSGVHRLMMISHGSGGTPYVYRGLAMTLAQNGYVVGLPRHIGNNRDDNSLVDTLENLTYRPRHLRLAIDEIVTGKTATNQGWIGKIKPDDIGLIGHSMGGYTILALAGGRPHTGFQIAFNPNGKIKSSQYVDVQKDGRVTRLVLFAPATPWFQTEDGLMDVEAPILMYTAEHDQITTSFHSEVILKGLPNHASLIHHCVQGAGHYSFLTPFPEAVKSMKLPPAMDPPGFDREKFHRDMNAEILNFLISTRAANSK